MSEELKTEIDDTKMAKETIEALDEAQTKPRRVKKKDPMSTVKELAKELGINQINVYPEKLELYEAKVGVDLERDGKLPFIMIFEGEGEGVINLAVERPDGTYADTKIAMIRVTMDTWNDELRKFKIKSRGFSGCTCAPAKKILKCNAKKIYLIY